MGHARHIGRIGALAVTLGVGVAIATTPGVGYAEPSSTSSSSDSTSTSDSTSPSDGTDAPSAGDTDPTSEATVDDDTAADDEDIADDPAEDVDDDIPIDDDASVDEVEEDTSIDSDGAEIPPTDAETRTVNPDSARDNDDVDSSDVDPVASAPSRKAAPVAASEDDGPTVDAQLPETVDRSLHFAPLTIETVPAATTFTTVTTPPPAPPRPTLVGVVTEFVASVLRPLLSFGEGSPIQIPILTAMLSAVRNEFERVLFPRTAKVATQQTISELVEPTTQRVLVIGVDGTNLSRILADDYNQNFFALMDTSTTAASSIVGHTTISNPSWSAILTGVWGERTGVINNVFTPWTYDRWPTVFNQLETFNPDIDTMAIGNWNVINAIAGAGAVPADRNVFIPQVAGDTDWLETDDDVADATIAAIAGADAPNFLFSYFVGVDENGHLYGGASQQYKDAIRNMDDNLGDIMAAVAAREAATGEDWTIIVVTDHGHQPQKGFGHGFQSPSETATFVIADGPDFKDGYINLEYGIVDTTPTVLSLFGGTPRGGSDGVPLMTLSAGDVLPDDLHQALEDAIAANDYPDLITNVALGLRTIFATIPYVIYEFGNDFAGDVPEFLVVPVKILFDGLYVATNVPAQIIALLTGVSGASIFPLLPPPPPDFPSEGAQETVVALCGGATEESWCSAGSVA